MQKTFSTEAGKTYRIRFKVNLRGWPYMYVKDVASTTNLISITDFMTPGDYSYIFTAIGFETKVIFHEAGNASGSVQICNFTLEEVEAENGYRFAFNGKEKDNETYGDGNEYDYGARIYDSRLGRWLSLDPLQAKYPSHSAYCYSINSPIRYQDIDGNVVVDAAGNIAVFINNAGKPEFTKYATDDIKTAINLMTKTDVGTKMAEQMITSCNKIKIVIDTKTSGIWDNKEKKFVEEANVNTSTKYGKTSTDTRPKDGSMPDVTITVYEKSFERDANSTNPDLVNSFGDSHVQVPQFKAEDIMGATFVHEAVHATDSKFNSHTSKDPKNLESGPKEQQLEHFRQLDKNENKDRILDKGEY